MLPQKIRRWNYSNCLLITSAIDYVHPLINQQKYSRTIHLTRYLNVLEYIVIFKYTQLSNVAFELPNHALETFLLSGKAD